MQRSCAKCKNLKNLEAFPKNKLKYLGRGHTCKECNLISNKRRSKTIIGIVDYLYYGQRHSSDYRNMPKPNYSKAEFKGWLLSQSNFQALYGNWIAGNYAKDLKPSTDRINDYLPYSLDNIQLMTWKENREKSAHDIKNGINNKQSRAVLQFDINGNLIKEFYSVAQAAREVNVNAKNITFCCQEKPRYKTAKGFIWKYKENKE